MSSRIKKILTEEDLVRFCQEQKFAKFSSKDTGYQLALKIPTTFSFDDNVDENHRGMAKLKIRIFHTGLNRNMSYVSKESAEKAMHTIADRPILAAIHQLDDGSYDFEGHEMEIVTNASGNEELKYIESQVGSFSSEQPFWEHDDESDKDYVCAYAYISKEYTKAYDILMSKQGTKNSCELFIDDLSYNAKENYLELNDFYVNGSTLLGSHSDGTEIVEGMVGSRADIVDFSVENNSVRFNKDDKVLEVLESIDEKLSNFNINNSKEGGKPDMDMDMNKDSFEEVTETVEVTVETTIEEEVVSTEETEEVEDTASTSEEELDEPVEDNDKFAKVFEISHDDIRYQLYELLADYEVADGTYYFISDVYDDYFVYEECCGDAIYGQKYTKENDIVALDGERYILHRELLTDSEYLELQNMRKEYPELVDFKDTIEKNELRTQKENILNDEKYSVLAENEKFVELTNNMDNYSLEELEKEAKIIFADHVATVGTFSMNTESNGKNGTVKLFGNPNKTKRRKRYGNLFD